MNFRGFGQGGLPRKGSRTKSFLPENAFQRFSEALARGSPPGKAPEQGCYYQECLPEALARGSPQERLQNKILMPRKGSRARFLLPGNAFQRLWPRGSPRKGTRRKLLLPGNAFEALAGDPAQEKAPEQDCYYLEMPSIGSGQGVPPGTALEQDRSHQAILSRGFGQGVPQERL